MQFIHPKSCENCENFQYCLTRVRGGEELEQAAREDGGLIDEGIMVCEGITDEERLVLGHKACRAEVAVLPDFVDPSHSVHAEAILGPMAINALAADDMLSRGEII